MRILPQPHYMTRRHNFHTAGFAVTGQPYHRIRPVGLQVRLKLCRQIANLPERISNLSGTEPLPARLTTFSAIIAVSLTFFCATNYVFSDYCG